MDSHFHYFSLQYSGIQKTVLRHDRLWSIAGISQRLSHLNEIKLPEITKEYNGNVIVAGGGKFTARFGSNKDGEDAKRKIIGYICTEMPMLEFQASRIEKAKDFQAAKKHREDNGKVFPGIIDEVNEIKKHFRGYGLTYNPHLRICKECGEYPAIKNNHERDWCSVCNEAHSEAKLDISELLNEEKNASLTTIQQIYKEYFKGISNEEIDFAKIEVPRDFDKMFPHDSEKGKNRLAVWFSDLNNMKLKVPLWLNQPEEKILPTFSQVKEINIQLLGSALRDTFPESSILMESRQIPFRRIPFRIIVAGGDDLCLVMPYQYILGFVIKYSKNLFKTIQELGSDHPLHSAYLQSLYEKNEDRKPDADPIKRPYCFGGSFIVTSVHTPFRKIHSLGEDLMSKAKKNTDRRWNSVNWRIMGTDEGAVSDDIVKFEKPVLIDNNSHKEEDNISGHLYFTDHINLCREYRDLSGSRIQQIAGQIIETGGSSRKLDTWLKRHPDSKRKKSGIYRLLEDTRFRQEGTLKVRRIATMLELLSIYRESVIYE